MLKSDRMEHAEVAELADALDSKSSVFPNVPVRVRPSAPCFYSVIFMPKWRNWQTHLTQNQAFSQTCRFESGLRHHSKVEPPRDAEVFLYVYKKMRHCRRKRADVYDETIICNIFVLSVLEYDFYSLYGSVDTRGTTAI